MDETLTAAFQEWHNLERQNEIAYRTMEAKAEFINWPGLTKWLHHAAKDERHHAASVAGYLIDRNILPEFRALEAIAQPIGDEHTDFFRSALFREMLTTSTIGEIYAMALESGDHDAARFMLPFLEEQTRSEREIKDYLTLLARPVDKLVFDQGLK